MQRKKKKRWVFLFLFLLLAVGVWYLNISLLTVTRVEIKDAKIQNPVTIVQLTDLHGMTFGKENAGLVQKIQKESPDLIVVTGDMYTYGDEDGKERAFGLLEGLAQQYPVYYVYGEHDRNTDFMERLSAAGVHVLDYTSEEITVGQTPIRLYGITNMYYTSTFDLSNEFTLDDSRYTILLAHISNFEAFADFGIDLSICGDTHGGQVRLPFLGAVQNRGTWFPEITGGEMERYTKGLYEDEKGDAKLFISSGLGNFPVPIRLLNFPEIAVIQLLPEA
ncbi:MAG TPA: metallophosphoesterase [Firmicutes bacterium]|nr:metallophosphoesterase [Bacillota bacterium]